MRVKRKMVEKSWLEKQIRLFNTDCLSLFPKIPDNYFDLILCDLPYGCTARNKWDHIIPPDQLWDAYHRIAKETAPIVLTATQPFASRLVSSNVEDFKYEWIWRKQQGTGFLNAKKQPLRNHEQILVFYRKQCTYNPQFLEGKPYTCKSGRGSTNYREQVSVVTENDGKRYPLTVVDFEYDRKKLHPTQKPLALFEYLIKTYTNEDDMVLDNCLGSGTTALACARLNRRCVGIEKDPEIYQKACDRVEEAVNASLCV